MLAQRKKRLIAREGKLTLGYRNKKELPVSTNYFVFVNPDTGDTKFEELLHIYGDKCTELLIKFPSENIEDFYNDSLDLYGSNNKKIRTCDGETCNHFIKEEIDGIPYEAGETACICKFMPDKHKKKCGFNMYLKFFILNPDTMTPISPLVYLFNSHSENNIGNVFSTLESFKNGNGKFAKMPFKFYTTEMQKGQKKTYFVNLLPMITPKMVIEVFDRNSKSLPPKTETKALEQNNGEVNEDEEFENLNLPF